MSVTTSAPIIQQQELTWRCNNNCSFCYNPERCMEVFEPRENDRQQNIAVAQASVERGVMAVCLTGGEPLLAERHFFEVLSIYQGAGCYTSINSNGRLITDSVSDKLALAGLRSALVSIHGVGELHDQMVGIHGAFQETLSGIKRLRNAGIAVIPNFVGTAKNIWGLYELGGILADMSVHSMTVTPFLPSWGSKSHALYVLKREHYRTYFETVRRIRSLGINIDSTLPIPPCTLIKLFPDEWEEFLDVHSSRVCMAGRSFGVVSPDGNFRACIQAPFFPEYGGSVLDNYTESWRRANSWANFELLSDACRDCQALEVCGGGCRTSCLWENQGSLAGATMYMGEPLTGKQAVLFKARTIFRHDTPKSGERHAFCSDIKFRDEGDGRVVVFNSRNQSFTILSGMASHLPFDGAVRIASEKVAGVLLAIQAIEPARDRWGDAMELTEISVLPGNQLLPRLAQRLNDEKTVYCLRADTGERYFF